MPKHTPHLCHVVLCLYTPLEVLHNNNNNVTLLVKMYYCFLYIVCTGSDRPRLIYLNLHVMWEAAHKWRDLGVSLGLEYNNIDVIAANYHRHDDRCRAVLERWLETTPDASWNQLIRALRSVELDSLANELEKMLNVKCKIYSNITTNCTL